MRVFISETKPGKSLNALVQQMPLIAMLLFSFQSAASLGATIRIQTIGDSITDGLAATNSYRGFLRDDLHESGVDAEFVGSRSNESNPASTLHHDGIPGQRVEQLAGHIVSTVAAQNPELALILIGTNNIYEPQDVAPAVASLKTMMDEITTDFPATHFIVSTIPLLANPAWDADARDYNQAVREMARANTRSNLSFVDIYPGLSLADLYSTLNGQPDGIHPNPGGHAKIAWIFATEILRAWGNTLKSGV